jgi:acyl-CoA hydrolase
VTTPHILAHYIVTEYGMVDLMGKSFADRAKLPISIAHPDFRDKLADDARRFGFI